jgi:hypothetical protein
VSVSSGMHFDNILVASSPANFFKKNKQRVDGRD